jgi:glycosyltransferase involved in cell wall biosynthesis
MADHVVVVTEAAKQVIVLDGLKDHDKIIVVPNTIQPEIFYKYKSNSEISARFANKRNILYLGDTSLRRGTDIAVKAMKRIVEHCPDAHLILVGESRDNDILKSLAQEFNVNDYISFEGWQDLKLFPTYIQVSDITISPLHRNLHHDTTYANKIFQYMAMGKPVVVSNCPAQQAVIEDENCGLVFKDRDVDEFSDRIITLLKDKSLAMKLGENGKNAVLKRWNWDITSKNLIEHYSG